MLILQVPGKHRDIDTYLHEGTSRALNSLKWITALGLMLELLEGRVEAMQRG